MASYDADLQAAVDATSVAKDAGVVSEDELLDHLRQSLADREIETTDDAWLQKVVEGIKGDRNYMIDGEPHDYESRREQ